MTLLVLAFALCFSPVPTTLGQDFKSPPDAQTEAKDVIKLNARLVNLNVSVMDRRGRKVTDLGREDFLVFEDGVEQEITYFDHVAAPVNLVLLMDLSGSIGSKLDPVKRAARRFVESLNRDDRVAVATFTSRFNIVSGFTTDKGLLKDRIKEIERPAGDTALYDAAWASFDLMSQTRQERKAVVILTDGVDSAFHPDEQGSRRSFDDLMMRAVEEDATVYPVYFDTEPETGGHYSAEVFSRARKQLQSLAEQTGGTYFSASRIEDLDGVYQRVSAELHSIYSLAYSAKDTRKDSRWRAIKVRINREGVAAITKRGYFAK
jgi:Ca-activated chloride channel family protein